MKTSIATVSLSGSLTEKLHACAAAGFDGVEIFEPDLIASDHSPEEIRALADRLGLSLDLYQPLRDIEGVDEDDVRRQPAPRRGQVRDRAAARHRHACWSAATSAPPPSTPTTSPPPSCAGSATSRGSTASRWRSRRWPGAATSTTTAAPGASCSSPTTRPSACASTASTSSPAATTRRRSRRSPADKIFFLQLADAPALTHGRAVVEPPPSAVPRRGHLRPGRLRLATCSPPATTGRSRWRSSTTPSGRPTPTAPRVHALRSLRLAAGQGRAQHRGLAARRVAAADRGQAAHRLRLRRGQGRGHQRRRGAARAARASPSAAATAPSRCRCGPRARPRVVLNEQQARDQTPHVAAVGFTVPDAERPRGAGGRPDGARPPTAGRTPTSSSCAASPPPTAPRSSGRAQPPRTPAGSPSSSDGLPATASRWCAASTTSTWPSRGSTSTRRCCSYGSVLGLSADGVHRGRRAGGPGAQPGDAHRRRRDPVAAQRRSARAGRRRAAAARRVRLSRRHRAGPRRPGPRAAAAAGPGQLLRRLRGHQCPDPVGGPAPSLGLTHRPLGHIVSQT